MAITATAVFTSVRPFAQPDVPKSLGMEVGTIAFDSSYPTNGESYDGIIGTSFREVTALFIPSFGGYLFEAVLGSTKKIKVRWSAASATVLPEITNATDLSALTAVPYIAFGNA